MRKTFPGYYRPSEKEFRKLWDKCLFVLDANVLLNLYRYSEETRKKLLDILKRIESRLWVPHQAALEYQRNRLEVISAQREAYKQIEQLLVDTNKKLETQLKSFKRHPLIDIARLMTSINGIFEEQAEELRKVRQKHPDLLQADDVREVLTKLLDGKVGQPYTEEKLKQICKEGEDRYAKSKPPGYKDAKTKDGDRAFGDLVLWLQVMDKAESDKVPVVIVTDDVKDDWWWRHEGKIVGPNPELVDEIRSKAGVDFYMYVSDQFMEYAREYLNQKVDQGAIDEIREVRKLDEQRRLHTEKLLMRTEQHVHKVRRELIILTAETAQLDAEIASLNQQLSEISNEPIEVRHTDEKQELIAQLVSRMHVVKSRRHALEEQGRRLDQQIAIEMEQRNLILHHRLDREHLIRSSDGTIRRVGRPRPHAIETVEPTAITDATRTREAGMQRRPEHPKID